MQVTNLNRLKKVKKYTRLTVLLVTSLLAKVFLAHFPPLAGSDYLADRTQTINVPLKGLSGKITVNGQDYNSAMPGFAHLSDEDIAAVLTYVTNDWGNEAAEFTADEVKALR